MLGNHYVADLYGCKNIHEKYEEYVYHLENVAKKHGATVLNRSCHNFGPNAYTLCILLAESHIAVHTWAEEKYVSVDIYTCGSVDTRAIMKDVIAEFQPVSVDSTIFSRGKKVEGAKKSKESNK